MALPGSPVLGPLGPLTLEDRMRVLEQRINLLQTKFDMVWEQPTMWRRMVYWFNWHFRGGKYKAMMAWLAQPQKIYKTKAVVSGMGYGPRKATKK